MIERVPAWQCIGCGRIEGAQPCIGICEDRRAEFVHAADYDAALVQLALARRQVEDLAALVRQIAHTTPHAGAFERTWLALQPRARHALDALAGAGQPGTPESPAGTVTRPPGQARAPASGRGSRPARRRRDKRR
jgi:hypothetical protein